MFVVSLYVALIIVAFRYVSVEKKPEEPYGVANKYGNKKSMMTRNDFIRPRTGNSSLAKNEKGSPLLGNFKSNNSVLALSSNRPLRTNRLGKQTPVTRRTRWTPRKRLRVTSGKISEECQQVRTALYPPNMTAFYMQRYPWLSTHISVG